MALSKTIMTDFGVEAKYWNIGSINSNFKDKTMEIIFYGYPTEEARRNNAQPLSHGNMRVEAHEFIADANREQIYAFIKTKPEFAGAEDC